MIERIPEDLKDQPVWGVVTAWSVDVLYDGLTYAAAKAYADEEAKKEGQHVKVVLVVESMDGPPMAPVKLRPRKVY